MLTAKQQQDAAKEFAEKWRDRGDEKSDIHNFWIELLAKVLNINDAVSYIQFEKRVQLDHTSFIDAYIPATRVLIEQKSLAVDLRKPQKQSDGTELTPYKQAKRYADNLGNSERPRRIITCNFREFLVYDMEKPSAEPESILLENLEKEYYRLSFISDSGNEHLKREMEISIQAGEIVGVLYDEILKQYKDPENAETLRSLNMLCVRLVFCLYAEDAGIFGKRSMFHDYLSRFEPRDFRKELIDLFKVLDTKIEDRDPYLEADLAAFPYVNGGLFADESVIIPQFTQEIKDILLAKASDDFDWSEISPTIFGAVFESTLNPVTRRSGGMHYTSIENIHKVIDPLFLDKLRDELAQIKDIKAAKAQKQAIDLFRQRLSELVFLDPACGSGNFLTETYLSLRRLENEAILAITQGQMMLDTGDIIKVSIGQFYGIEINDFAVTVARTALWIAESRMMHETESIIRHDLDFLPLKSYANITEGNALRIDWETVVPKEKLSYIMGNPPFVGASMMTDIQKQEVVSIFGKIKLSNSIDYVGGWYFKACDYIQQTNIKAALVSTNSITQGEQVAPLFGTLFSRYNMHIDYAYRTFRWDSESNSKAHVHCVIVGFSCGENKEKRSLFDGESVKLVDNINAYLLEAVNAFITSRSTPLCSVPKMTMGNKPTDDGNFILSVEEKEKLINNDRSTPLCSVPKMTKGNQPTDDGNFILSVEEKEKLINNDKSIECCIRRYVGARDYLNNNVVRYCLWLKNISPSVYRHNKEIQRRLAAIKEFREKSTAAPTRKSAEKPYVFFSSPQTDDNYMIIPRVSSERRKYIPIGFMPPEVIAADSCSIICGATLFHFGVLTSNTHMAWMRTVCGRLGIGYRYSGSIVYNNFPWCTPTDEQKTKIEQTAQAILDARGLYPDSSLADLYDELTMPAELRRAHQANDKAVWEAYGRAWDKDSESECVARLMKMYKEMVK